MPAVLRAELTYAMAAMLLPIATIQYLEKHCSALFWTGE